VREGGAPGAAEKDATKGEEDDDTKREEDNEEDEYDEEDQDEDEDEDERPFYRLLAHVSFQKRLPLEQPRFHWVFQLRFVSHKNIILPSFNSALFPIKSSSIPRSLFLSFSPCLHLSIE
jgi:hypothetical protein